MGTFRKRTQVSIPHRYGKNVACSPASGSGVLVSIPHRYGKNCRIHHSSESRRLLVSIPHRYGKNEVTLFPDNFVQQSFHSS